MASDREILFEGFTRPQQREFLGLGIAGRCLPQAEILRQDEPGGDMLIVEEGILSIWLKGSRISEVGPESVLGASVLLEPHPRTVSAIAETEAEVLRFPRRDVLDHLRVSPGLFHRFFVNAFRIHLNLIRRCEERIVQLSERLSEAGA